MADIVLRNPGAGTGDIALSDPSVPANLGTSTWTGLAASGVPGTVSVTAGVGTSTWSGLAASESPGAVSDTADLGASAWSGLSATGAPGAVSVTADLGTSAWSALGASEAPGLVSVSADLAVSTWSGLAATALLPETDVTGALLEALVADATGTRIAGAVLEVVSANPTETWVDGVLLEVLGADDVPSVRVSGVVLEVLLGDQPGDTGIGSVVLEVLCGSVPQPVDVPVPLYPDIAERRFGRDLVLAFPDQVVSPTPTGDWPSIAGRANLHAAMRRRLATSPGQLVHRPQYGAGLELFVGELNEPGERARLAAGARQNVLRDPRISEAGVAVSEPEAGQVVVQLAIQPTGEVQTDTVSVVSEG